jgi:peptide-methionine (R)-S-oxide reductase
MINRRILLLSGAAALVAGPVQGQGGRHEITRTVGEWRARLTPAQFAVLREKRTEHAHTNHLGREASPLLAESRAGAYCCAGCALPLYRSETKYDSRTGWPSFRAEIDGAVTRYDDSSLFFRRTGVECRRCGGHLGHVFEDGPPPTGQRHCLNGLALTFLPDGDSRMQGHPVPYPA